MSGGHDYRRCKMLVLLDNDNIAEIINNKVTRVMIDLAGTCLLSSYNKEDCNRLSEDLQSGRVKIVKELNG